MKLYKVKTTYKYMFDTEIVLENGSVLKFPSDFAHTISEGNYLSEYSTDSGTTLAYYCNGKMHFSLLPMGRQFVKYFLDQHMTKAIERMALNAALIRALQYQKSTPSLSLERNLVHWMMNNEGKLR